MNATKPRDDLSGYYADLLEGAYDCVDRIVVNACFPLGQTGGGPRSWWRVWQGGEKTLSGAGMKAVAGDFARRLKAWCQKQRIPWIECQSGEQKHVLAESLLPKDLKFRGVFAVLVARAPAPVWQVQHNQRGQIVNLCHRDPWPHVQHYYFQIVDPDWGHVMVRMCGDPPFGAQVVLNGHEWVQRQGRRRRYGFCQEGHCFLEALKAGKVLEKPPEILGRMQQMRARFLAVVQAAHLSFLEAGQWESWADPTQRGNRRLAGLDMTLRQHLSQTFELLGLAA